VSQGVVYLLSGLPVMERLAVSVFTLRQHYDGPVTILTTSKEDTSAAKCLADDKRAGVDVLQFEPVETDRRHQAYQQKTLVPAYTPYDQTVFLDADTTIAAPFPELFEGDCVITAYSDWQTKGKRVAGRCGWWKGRDSGHHLQVDEMVARVLADEVVVTEEKNGRLKWRVAKANERVRTQGYPAINTGVTGWKKGNPFADRWRAMTAIGMGTHMTDEIAMQLLYPFVPECDVRLFDDRFNASPIYAVNADDARIWHFHGQKHLKKEPGRSMWEPIFREAMAAKWGKLPRWAGRHDKWVKALLDGRDPAKVR